MERMYADKVLRAHHKWIGRCWCPRPWVNGERYGGKQKEVEKESGMTSDAQFGRTEIGIGKWNCSGWPLNELQSMSESSHMLLQLWLSKSGRRTGLGGAGAMWEWTASGNQSKAQTVWPADAEVQIQLNHTGDGREIYLFYN